MLRRAFTPLRTLAPATNPGGAYGIVSAGQRRKVGHFVPSQMPIVKQKWKTVDVIKATTETMKNVAAGKLPSVERFLKNARPFHAVTEPFFDIEQDPPADQLKNVLHIVVATERGLCGFAGSNIVREMAGEVRKDRDAPVDAKRNHMVVVYGKKGMTKLSAMVPQLLKKLDLGFGNVKMSNNHFSYVCDTVDDILKLNWDVAYIYHNKYKNTTSFAINVKKMFRLDLSEAVAKVQFPAYEVEADETTIVHNLHDYKLAAEIYHAMCEQRASEEGCRLQSMDGAVQACKEKSAEYEKIYQKLRQTKITSELTVLAAGVKTLQAAKKRHG